MNKTILTLLTALAATTVFADVSIYRGGGYGRRGNGDVIRVSYQHVPLTDPSEPYHETYRKNLGEVNRKAPKPVANAHAKRTAAQADALRNAAQAERAQRSSISVYSNVSARRPTQTPSSGNGGGGSGGASGGNTIYISNSNVTIGNN